MHVENELMSEQLFERLLAGTSHLCLVNDFLASFCVQHIMMSVWFGPLIQAPKGLSPGNPETPTPSSPSSRRRPLRSGSDTISGNVFSGPQNSVRDLV